jgi:hypothetical protein
MRQHLATRLTRGAMVTTMLVVGFWTQPVAAAARKKPTVSITPSTASLQATATLQLQAVDATGKPVAAKWSSDNTAVARVSGSGLVEALAAGSANITAVYNRAKASCTLQVLAPVVPPAPPPPAPVVGSPTLPFGPKQLPYTEFGLPPWSGAYVNASSLANLGTRVQSAQQFGLRLIVKLAPAHVEMLNPVTGCFDISLWKLAIDKLASFDFAPYVADGTVLGAELVNEPHASDWCVATARRLTKAEVEEMAVYAKAIWPALPVGAGRSDWVLANAPWAHLDFAHSQYHTRKGDAVAWRDQTIREAMTAGVGHVMSLDYLAGAVGDVPMTADELRYYGSVLAQDTYSCLLTGYLHDTTYNAQPGVMAAFDAVAWVANSHPAPPCFVGSVK